MVLGIRWNCLRKRIKYIVWLFIILLSLDFFGAFTHIFEIDFYTDFHYPLEGDVIKYAQQIRHNQKPDVDPINIYNYTFLYDCKHKCMTNDEETNIVPKIVFLVKTAMENSIKRAAIRKSWGFERRFSDVIVRTVFFVGYQPGNIELQNNIDIEAANYKDIVQGNYLDTYFNNTIKTMMAIKWAMTYCAKSKFYMLIDDDFYVSTKNVLRFIRNPVHYPEYLEEADETLRKLARRLSQTDLLNDTNVIQYQQHDPNQLSQIKHIVDTVGIHSIQSKKHLNDINRYILNEEKSQGVNNNNNNKPNFDRKKREKRHLLDVELPNDAKLFAGFVFTSAPHRHKSSKWYVSLDEYPWHMWPSYVTAGALIMSHETLIEMYYVSMFTKHFRFDDIYLSIVALKAKIEPLHSEEFYFHKATYSGAHSYRYVIASHGYSNIDEMIRVWTECRSAGHA